MSQQCFLVTVETVVPVFANNRVEAEGKVKRLTPAELSEHGYTRLGTSRQVTSRDQVPDQVLESRAIDSSHDSLDEALAD